MGNVQIANKLSDLYCMKADTVENEYNLQNYGIKCSSEGYPKDINLQIDILEYYNNMNSEFIEYHLLTNECLKKILNG